MVQDNPNPTQSPAQDKNMPGKHSFLKDDFPLIRTAILVLVASLLSSAAMVETSRAILSTRQNNMTQAQTQLNDALSKRRQAEADTTDIHDYQSKYLQLCQQGFVGEEKRLDWIAQIKDIKESRKLFPITYEISAQRVFQVAPEVSMGDLELRGSKMKLGMNLLHEGDLLNFLDDLHDKGFYTVQECTIKRGLADTESAHLPLTAECNLLWLTVGERTASPAQPPQ